jgi:hypothetical protein
MPGAVELSKYIVLYPLAWITNWRWGGPASACYGLKLD